MKHKVHKEETELHKVKNQGLKVLSGNLDDFCGFLKVIPTIQ